MNFEQWYKQRITRHEAAPPARAWDNIQDTLDIDESWDDISDFLRRDLRQYRLKKAATISVFTAAVVIFSLLLFRTVSDWPSPRKALVVQNVQPPKKGLTPAPGLPQFGSEKFLPTAENSTQPPEWQKKKTKEDNQQLAPSQSIELKSIEQGALSVDLPEISSLETQRHHTPKAMSARLYHTGDSVKMLKEKWIRKSKQKPRFYVGVGGSVSNPWLLNYETSAALQPKELSRVVPAFTNYGFAYGGIDFSPRFGLQAELRINETAIQHYKKYRNGKYIDSQTHLHYASLDVLALFSSRVNYSAFDLRRRLFAGIKYQHLRRAHQIDDNQQTNIANLYQNQNYAFTFGFGYQMKLNPQWAISSKMTANLGLQNIWKGDSDYPASFKPTRTASFDATLSITYFFKNKPEVQPAPSTIFGKSD